VSDLDTIDFGERVWCRVRELEGVRELINHPGGRSDGHWRSGTRARWAKVLANWSFTPRQMIPHPFSPQECDNEEMDQDSKPLQNRKDQRVVRERLRLHSLLGILARKS